MNDRSSGWIWWDCLVAKRFGFLMAISLLIWPILTTIPALETILSNVMLLDSYPRLFFFTFINVIAFVFATAILRVLYSRHPTGTWMHSVVGDGAAPWGMLRIWGLTFLAIITPMLLATRFGTEFEPPDWPLLRSLPAPFSTTLAVSISAVVAVGFLWLLGWLKCLLVGSQKDAANFFPFEALQYQGIRPIRDVLDKLETKLKPLNFTSTDLQLGVYLGLLAVLHRGLLPVIEADRYHLSSAPSAIVLLIWLIGMILSGMAHLLDRFRIPVIICGVLILTIVFTIVGSTRPFPTVDRSAAQVSPPNSTETNRSDARVEDSKDVSKEDLPWKAIENRMKHVTRHQEKGKTLVIVTCPGGGIHAAAWSACVLDRLCEEYEGFEESLCVISGVSGGSVGTLMFVGSRYESSLLDKKATRAFEPSHREIIRMLNAQSPALELATRSSLEAISFGATVDDLYGLIGLPRMDRGERMEKDFSNRLAKSLEEKTLNDWGAKSLEGLVPIVVFNATDAISGRRVLFDSVPTPTPNWEPTRNQKARPWNYRELLVDLSNKEDVLPVTAARISATFPYVSPFTKPPSPTQTGKRVALCDGGYVDNEGIVTAVTWIDHLLGYWFEESEKTERTFDRILLLRIEPALSLDEEPDQNSMDTLSYVRWLVGPLEAMMNVRSTSQLERGNLEAALVKVDLDECSKSPIQKTSEQKVEELQRRWSRRNPSTDQTKRSPEGSISKSESKQSIRDLKMRWDQEIEDMVQRAKDLKQIPVPPKPTPNENGEVVDKSLQDAPVIVESIRFRDAGQSIPLSWKLSQRQKLWYLLSWQKIDELNPNLRRTLGKYFTRK